MGKPNSLNGKMSAPHYDGIFATQDTSEITQPLSSSETPICEPIAAKYNEEDLKKFRAIRICTSGNNRKVEENLEKLFRIKIPNGSPICGSMNALGFISISAKKGEGDPGIHIQNTWSSISSADVLRSGGVLYFRNYVDSCNALLEINAGAESDQIKREADRIKRETEFSKTVESAFKTIVIGAVTTITDNPISNWVLNF